MSVVRAIVGRREERAISQASAWGDWPGSVSGETWAGSSVDTSNAMQLLTVYGCASFIVDGITTLPVDVFRQTPSGKVEAPKPEWMRNPTPDLTFEQWAGQVLTSLLLAGNAYCFLDYQGGALRFVTPIDPQQVTVKSAGRKIFVISGRQYDSTQILHIPGLMMPGSLTGVSPVEAARQTIGSGMASEEFAGKFFDQGAVMSGVIEVPGDLNPDNARAMARTFAKRHSGKDKAHLPGVLVGGATWKPTGVTNDQAQFLQTRKFTAAQIAGLMFRIDPSELGIPVEGTSLTYTNQEQRNIRKVQVSFLPWIVRLEHAVSSLLAASGMYMKLNIDGLLRGDQKSRYEAYKIGLGEGFILDGEVRAWEELPPLPDVPPSPPSLVEQIEAVGALIRAGFEPAAALQAVGLPDIAHTGLVPVTVKPEDV